MLCRRLALGVLQVARRSLGFDRWSWLPASEREDHLEIASIVSPLRYDVLVRRQMVSFYLSQRRMFEEDFPRFVALALSHPYSIWFEKVFVPRFLPHLQRNPALLREGYAYKLRRLALLYDAMASHGFDSSRPIELLAGSRLRPCQTGKVVSGRYFLGDGCHRVAVLMALGRTSLPRDHYAVRQYRVLSPLDITGKLMGHMRLRPAEYFQFLSARYTAPERCDDAQALFTFRRAHRPQLLEEVREIVRRDGFA